MPARRTKTHIASLLIVWSGWGAPAHAETPTIAEATEPVREPSTYRDSWQLRAGFGASPAFNYGSSLPQAHTGVGGSVTGYYRVTSALRIGLGFDWDRFTFDSGNRGDPPDAPPRYTDEPLTQTRLMTLLEWDIVASELLTPFVGVGLGYGWQDAEVTRFQCSPRLISGPVFGAGAGLDVAVSEHVSVGVEYRANSLPFGLYFCTLAFIPTEPEGPPNQFLAQRAGLTVALKY